MGLLLEGELCVCELMAILELPQSTVSRHLSYLKNSGLVRDRREGVWMHYQLTAGDGALHQDLIALLKKDLTALPQVRDDRAAFRKYISPGRAPACCERGD